MRKIVTVPLLVLLSASLALTGCKKSGGTATATATPLATAPAVGSMTQMFGGAGVDLLTGVTPLPDGGLIMIGMSYNSAGSGALMKLEARKGTLGLISRLDSKGKLVWSSMMGGLPPKTASSEEDSDSGTVFLGMVKVSDGVIVLGKSTEFGQNYLKDFGQYENKGAFMAKYDLNGKQLWVKAQGAADDFFYAGVLADAQHIVVTGQLNGKNIVNEYTLDGTLVWSTQVTDTVRQLAVCKGYFAVCGEGKVYQVSTEGKLLKTTPVPFSLYGICAYGDGFAVAGGTDSATTQADLDKYIPKGADTADYTIRGATDAVIALFDKTATLTKWRLVGGASNELFNSICLSNDGKSLIVAGGIESGSFQTGDFANSSDVGQQQAIIIRFDKQLESEWKLGFANSASASDQLMSITKDGKYYIAVGMHDSDGTETDVAYHATGTQDGIVMRLDEGKALS